ncbi:MAG: type II secretion system protein [Magnetococcales bacterium]|nr:type II secretion system protein [Magnetococcales bacterium]
MMPRRPVNGFTLLEVMVTLFLVSILLSLVIPHLAPGKLEGLRLSASRFRHVLIWLRDQGASGLADYRLRLDLTQGSYHPEVRDGENYLPVADPLLAPGRVDPGVGRLVWIPDKSDLGELSDLAIPFTRFGPVKALLVQFVSNTEPNGFTVSYRPEWSHPRLEAGLKRWE